MTRAAVAYMNPRYVLAVFRQQKKDTAEIAQAFCMTEAVVVGLLHEGREAEMAARMETRMARSAR